MKCKVILVYYLCHPSTQAWIYFTVYASSFSTCVCVCGGNTHIRCMQKSEIAALFPAVQWTLKPKISEDIEQQSSTTISSVASSHTRHPSVFRAPLNKPKRFPPWVVGCGGERVCVCVSSLVRVWRFDSSESKIRISSNLIREFRSRRTTHSTYCNPPL